MKEPHPFHAKNVAISWKSADIAVVPCGQPTLRLITVSMELFDVMCPSIMPGVMNLPLTSTIFFALGR